MVENGEKTIACERTEENNGGASGVQEQNRKVRIEQVHKCAVEWLGHVEVMEGVVGSTQSMEGISDS